LLRKCDAVLFLLSPDPPLTLTEMEFLKEVRKAVPRIFFILNKIDLLTIDDLKKIDRFIQSVLSKSLGVPGGIRVFHVSAKMGQSLTNRPENDPAWRLSGMASVRTEIIDFMVREKYFTLSQAIVDKFKEAIARIRSLLDSEGRELLSPADSAAQEYETIVRVVNAVRTSIDKELGMMEAENKAFEDFAEKTIATLKPDVQRRSSEALRVVLESAPLKKTELSHAIYGGFEQHAGALFDHFFVQVVSAINKPLKKAVALHAVEFTRLIEEAKGVSPSASLPALELQDLADDLEIKADSPWKLEGVAAAFQHIKLPFCGVFASDRTKRQRYRECFNLAIIEIINLNIIRFSMFMNELILASCKKLKKTLTGRSEELLKAMGKVMEEKKRILDTLESTATTRVKELEKKKAAFKEIDKMLT
jgi:hypothetical protein